MNTFVKAILFSISTAVITAPAMAATQSQHDKLHHVERHHVDKHRTHFAKHEHRQHVERHVPKKAIEKHHAHSNHVARHDFKHRS